MKRNQPITVFTSFFKDNIISSGKINKNLQQQNKKRENFKENKILVFLAVKIPGKKTKLIK